MKDKDLMWSDSETRLYVLSIENITEEQDYQKLYNASSKDRQAKADRVKNFGDKLRCICAHQLLQAVYRKLNSEYPMEIQKEMPDIYLGEKGKPYFKNSPLYFNLSHSKQRIIIAVSPMEVGCDVECKKNESLRIAERFFAPEEYHYLCSNDDFTGVWTVKESVIKACGEGMSYSMKDFCVVKNNEIATKLILSADSEKYYIKRYQREGEYEYSCCGKSDRFEKEYRTVSYDSNSSEFIL